MSFPSLLSRTFSNAKKNASYSVDGAHDSYVAIKTKFSIDDSKELKRTMRTTRLKNESILDNESVYDIHKIQRDRELSNFILVDNVVDETGDYNLLKNQPLDVFV
jgi:hypothetical protein